MIKKHTERGRTFLYHRDFPGGQIFCGDAEINQKLGEGWKEAPYPEVLADVSAEVKEVPEKAKEESPSGSKSLKPWEKAVAAKKAKRDAAQGGK
jgi:hypothetical protein